MKRILILLSILFTICLAQKPLVSALNLIKVDNSKADTWKKTNDNSWPGVVDKDPYWYKMDKHGTLWWSSDRKNWEKDPDGMWADKEGIFYKIDSHKVVFSPDGGNTWQETPDWKWLATDLRWYKLDKDWVVWVNNK